MLQKTLQKESKANKRLSMENEELLWKLHNGLSPRNSASFPSSPVFPRWPLTLDIDRHFIPAVSDLYGFYRPHLSVSWNGRRVFGTEPMLHRRTSRPKNMPCFGTSLSFYFVSSFYLRRKHTSGFVYRLFLLLVPLWSLHFTFMFQNVGRHSIHESEGWPLNMLEM